MHPADKNHDQLDKRCHEIVNQSSFSDKIKNNQISEDTSEKYSVIIPETVRGKLVLIKE